MAKNYITRSEAMADLVHRMFHDEAYEQLHRNGSYSIEGVLKAIGISVALASSIRADYVNEWLADPLVPKKLVNPVPGNDGSHLPDKDPSMELVPVVERFFDMNLRKYRVKGSRTAQYYDPHRDPEKFIAHGYGKRTAGFAKGEDRNGKIMLRRLEQLEAVRGGVNESVDAFRSSAEVEGLLPPVSTGNLLPPVETSADLI